jgi:hypothetical protein
VLEGLAVSVEEFSQARGVPEVRAGHRNGEAQVVKDRKESERVEKWRDVERLAQAEGELLKGGVEAIDSRCEVVDENLFVCLGRQYMVETE